MTNMREIRLQQLKAALAEHGFVAARLAERIGKSPAQISQWLSGYRSINEDTARHIERRLYKPVGWMDQSPSAPHMQEPTPIAVLRPAWPFSRLSEREVCALPAAQIARLEDAMLLIAEAMQVSIKRRAA